MYNTGADIVDCLRFSLFIPLPLFLSLSDLSFRFTELKVVSDYSLNMIYTEKTEKITSLRE